MLSMFVGCMCVGVGIQDVATKDMQIIDPKYLGHTTLNIF